MALRYAGTCRLCGAALQAGAMAVYERPMKTVRCLECPHGVTAPDVGTAGASARREYDRRKDNREKRIREAHPKIGGLILALSDDPQSTKAWESGAVGEELLAQRLTDLPETFQVLHDRRIPGTRANIDHIVIGPSGVWVIDAKRYKGQRPALHTEGGLFRPRVKSLRVGGRDRTKLVEGIQSQVGKVAAAVGVTIPVTGVLCFLDADWPLFGGSFVVDDVHVTWPKALIATLVEKSDPDLDVTAIHARIARTFPRA